MDWEQRFKDKDTPWQRPGLNPAFAEWFGGAAGIGGLSVLVPGCGTAPEPLALARLGAAVTCLDVAPTAIARQQEAFATAGQRATFVLSGLDGWRPDHPVDVIYEQTCLCAISPKLRPDYERFAFDSLKPGGRLFALFMQTGVRGGPPYDCPLDDMRALFPANRWRWPAAAPLRADHHRGSHELGFVLEREQASR